MFVTPFSKTPFEPQEGEKALKIIRKTKLLLVGPVFKTLLYFFIPILVLNFFGSLSLLISSGTWAFITLCWFLIGLTYIYYEFTLWWLDVYIITNLRIIDIEQKTLFSRSVAEAELENIQDVKHEINGFWQTVFRFGAVGVQTAGASETIILDDVENPAQIQKEIVKIIQENQKETPAPLTAQELIEAIQAGGARAVSQEQEQEPRTKNQEQ